MKKNILILASLALIAAVSCNKEEAGSENSATQTPETASSIEFTAIADGDATRTTLNGLNVEWVEYDEISINGVQFITEDSGPSAVFKLYDESDVFVEADEYIAVYPYSSDNSDDNYGNYLNISENIFAEAGNIPNAEVVSIAKSNNNELYFKNLSSMIKFKVPADFAEPITEITISADQQMSGNVYFGWDEAGNPTWTSDENDSNNVLTITCFGGSFETGVEYYIPILPGEKTNLTVRINGYLSATKSSCTFTRSTIHNLGTLPTPIASDWGIKGNHNSWGTPTAMYKESDSWSVAKNVALDGEFKFYKDDGSEYGAWIGGTSPSNLNSWYGAADSNISLSDYSNADGYDIYFNESKSQYCVVLSGDEVPEAPKVPEILYLTPNSNWKVDNARFAAYFFGSGETWVNMTDTDGDGTYEVNVPSGYPNVIFCRMNPSSAENGWDTRWNQTSDLTIPTDGTNWYTIKDGTWDKGGGTWATK